MSQIAAEQTFVPSKEERARNQVRQVLRRFFQRRLARVGCVLVVLEIAIAALAPVLARYKPNSQNFLAVLQKPSVTHFLGTDDLGRDIFSRLVYGARLSLEVSLIAVSIALIVGVPLGLLTGYLGGVVDGTIMRIMDSFIALPSLVLALTIASVLGPGLFNAMIAIGIVGIPSYARLVRGQVLSAKQYEYVHAAHALGASIPRILFRHILPNVIGPIIVQASLGIGFAIITEASLSFIGLGAQPPTPTWGSMVQVGFQYLEIAPWFVLAPAGLIFLAVMGFNLLGDGLRDAFDPTLRSSG